MVTGEVSKAKSSPEVRASCAPWFSAPAPQDGTTIVAVGRVICSDEISTWVEPVTAAVIWERDQSGYEGWHYARADEFGNRLSVARTLDDEVRIDYWLPFPKEVA